MRNRIIKITLSLLFAVLFLWLAFKNVDFQDLINEISTVTLWWVIPFTFVMLSSHFLRAERWRLLLVSEGKSPLRSTLFAGVMLGYVMNNIFPRLGEISRPVYVARKLDMSTGNLIGTIVLERLIDLICMLLLLLFVVFYLVGDTTVLEQIFGTESWTSAHYMIIPVVLLLGVFAIWASYRLLLWIQKNKEIKNVVLVKIIQTVTTFTEGVVAIKNVKNWPLFILYTAGIWTGYAVMTWLPFTMLNLHIDFDLGVSAAVVTTAVSAVGISIPTPAAIGTYHLFIQQCLYLLFEVPLLPALTYATVTHGINILLVFITGPIILWWDKWNTLKNEATR
jgi:uncharacterized protein (TIRG00374 family)